MERRGIPRGDARSEGPGVMRGDRRDSIVQAARSLYERQGVSRTSVARVMREAGLTRELFYYYFEDKDQLTEAVVREYIAEFVDCIMLWDEEYERGDADFADGVATLRRFIYTRAGRRPMQDVLEETGAFFEVVGEALEEGMAYLRRTDAYDVLASRCAEQADGVVSLVLAGIVATLMFSPETPDAQIAYAVGVVLRDVSDAAGCA